MPPFSFISSSGFFFGKKKTGKGKGKGKESEARVVVES